MACTTEKLTEACQPVAALDELPPIGVLYSTAPVVLVENPPETALGCPAGQLTVIAEVPPLVPVADTTTVFERPDPEAPCGP